MTHALFSITTKEVLNSFDYDDKEGYFVRKITNKLILIPAWKKKQANTVCCLVPQVIFNIYMKSGINPAKCISHEWPRQRKLNYLYV